MNYTILLTGERIRLRQPTLKDKDDLLEIFADKSVVEPFCAEVMTGTEVEEFIKKKQQLFKDYIELFLVIELISENIVIGYITLLNEHSDWQIEFAINKNYRRNGFAKLALVAIENLCKENNLRKILARVKKTNLPSIELLKSIGFQEDVNFYKGTPYFGKRREIGVNLFKITGI